MEDKINLAETGATGLEPATSGVTGLFQGTTMATIDSPSLYSCGSAGRSRLICARLSRRAFAALLLPDTSLRGGDSFFGYPVAARSPHIRHRRGIEASRAPDGSHEEPVALTAMCPYGACLDGPRRGSRPQGRT